MSQRGRYRGVPVKANRPRSSVPLLAALPLYSNARGITDLDPHWAPTGSIGAVHPLGDDALSAKSASVRENDRTILSDVFVEQDAHLGAQ
jgi:hypothetical protein